MLLSNEYICALGLIYFLNLYNMLIFHLNVLEYIVSFLYSFSKEKYNVIYIVILAYFGGIGKPWEKKGDVKLTSICQVCMYICTDFVTGITHHNCWKNSVNKTP